MSLKVSISPDVLSQQLDGETVLLDLGSESYFGLDETGTRIWQLLTENEDVSKVFEQLLREYEIDRSTLEIDFNEHLQQLQRAGLISLAED